MTRININAIYLTLKRDLDLYDQGQGHKFTSKAFKQKAHQYITYYYKDVHVKNLICTKLGECQGHNFITIQRKNLRFLSLHRL